MSVIYANVNDQVLRITEAPILASGGKGETKVKFTFCEKWDGFYKTATFEKGEDVAVQMPLNGNDICEVPWEVYDEPGEFLLGVFGVRDDIIRTTTKVKYKVRQGASRTGSAGSEPNPTPGVYEQIMADIAAIRSEQEGFIEEVEDTVSAAVEATNHAADNANKIAQELTEARANGEFNGKDGITPHIGENGNWYLGEEDTGKPSRGEPGTVEWPAITSVSVTEASDGSVMMVNTLEDGDRETIVISADADGNPSGLTYNGTAIPLTFRSNQG